MESGGQVMVGACMAGSDAHVSGLWLVDTSQLWPQVKAGPGCRAWLGSVCVCVCVCVCSESA